VNKSKAVTTSTNKYITDYNIIVI